METWIQGQSVKVNSLIKILQSFLGLIPRKLVYLMENISNFVNEN